MQKMTDISSSFLPQNRHVESVLLALNFDLFGYKTYASLTNFSKIGILLAYLTDCPCRQICPPISICLDLRDSFAIFESLTTLFRF